MNFASLRQLTKPFILRRMKTDRKIIQDLPDKTELTTWCTLTKEQSILYRQALQELSRELKETEDIQRSGVVLKYLLVFKQICIHPALFTGSGNFDFSASGKFLRLKEIAEEIFARQEKMIIFTQFREMTDVLHDFLAQCSGQSGLILHGGTPIKKRQELVEQFQETSVPYFVLSLKAAGVGLNLTSASHVVHFDRWWNPAVENQATDRAYRIGQKRNVLVHKFVCRSTIEERIHELIRSKYDLSENILSVGVEKQLTAMSNEELRQFAALSVE